jgi:hypothetical protein
LVARKLEPLVDVKLRGYGVSDLGGYPHLLGPRGAEARANAANPKTEKAQCDEFATHVFLHLTNRRGPPPRGAPRVERIACGAHNLVLVNRQPSEADLNSRDRPNNYKLFEYMNAMVVDAWQAAMGHDYEDSVFAVIAKRGIGWDGVIKITESWNPTIALPDYRSVLRKVT